MNKLAYLIIALLGYAVPTYSLAGTTELKKYLGDKQECYTTRGDERIKTETGWGMCTSTLLDVKCPNGRCTVYDKPDKYGYCPEGARLNPCPSRGHPACGEYKRESVVGKPGTTECRTMKGGYLKSEISFPDEIELREGEHTEIKVKGDCTAITIGSKGGKIVPQETRVCGTGNVKIHKQPGAEGPDYVEIKAQIVQ